jgi:hypothetical protein
MLRIVPFLLLALCLQSARAEEGMWTFDNPPTRQLQKSYGFTPTQPWLDHVRLSSVRLNDGGSGSFVSPHGLLLTNHHVALGQLQKSSTAEHDYVTDGFLAATQADEMKCPDLEVNVLESMQNVTPQVLDAAKTPADELARRKAVFARLTRESQQATGLRSDMVTLYQGGEYWLYRYKKYTDVRIAFATEQQIAYYGGDPDNFTYPRYDLDMALFRVYENGKPLETPNYLKWNPQGAPAGALVFVSGNPGSTQRLDTMAQLELERDVTEPTILTVLRDRREVLRRFMAEGPKQKFEATARSLSLENSIKAFSGRLAGLRDASMMAKKKKQEDNFRARVQADPQWRSKAGGAWNTIAQASAKARPRLPQRYYRSLDSPLADIAQHIVEYVAEIHKPDARRLPGYHEAQLESLRFRMLSPAPLYADLERARLTGALQLAQRQLGSQDPFVQTVLAGRTPEQAAHDLVDASRLTDVAERKKLLDGGPAAVAASTDPMIVMARKLDPMRRELIKWFEDNVESVEQQAGQQLGQARFAMYGKSVYPDATFTLRLSYGQVKGFPMNGTEAPPKTTFYGLYERAASFDDAAPFDLPARWQHAQAKLDLSTPYNFVTTNDIIGGNSGSPVIDRDGELVGLIFDGNIESLVGDFFYDGRVNRAVAVHTAAMTEAMRKLYGARQLVDELLAK